MRAIHDKNRWVRLLRTAALAVLLLPAGLGGQPLSSLPGAFADLNLGVRPAGMAGAYTALSTDGNAVLFNPAAAAFTPFGALTATATRVFNIVPALFLGAHWPAGSFSLVGGFQQIGDDLLRESTVSLGLALPASRLLPGAGRWRFIADHLSISTTLRLRLASFGKNEDGGEQRITGDGRGYAVDFGVYMRMNGLRFGATWHDALGQFRWDSSGRGRYRQNIPGRLRFGFAVVQPRLRFSMDTEPALHREINTRVLTGLEMNIVDWLVVRGGVARNIGGQFENRVATLGFGVYSMTLSTYRLAVQASYRTGELESAYRLAIDIFWPKRRH